jgi:hypothetical protein
MACWRDNPGRSAKVLWYFVPQTRPRLPYDNPFMSRVWDQRDQDPSVPVGELFGSQSYSSGLGPSNLTGLQFCGTQQQWNEGALNADPLPVVVGGFSACCGPPALAEPGGNAGGGLVILWSPFSAGGGGAGGGQSSPVSIHGASGGGAGGGAVATVPVAGATGGGAGGGNLAGAACSAISGGYGKQQYNFTASGFTDDNCLGCPNLDGDWTLTYQPQNFCDWQGPVVTGTDGYTGYWDMHAISTTTWFLVFVSNDPLGSPPLYRAVVPSWNGAVPLTFLLYEEGACCNGPSSLVVNPV